MVQKQKINGTLFLGILFLSMISSLQFGCLNNNWLLLNSSDYNEDLVLGVTTNTNATLQQDYFNDTDFLVSEDNLNVNIDDLDGFTAINSSIKVSGIEDVYTQSSGTEEIKTVIEDPVLDYGTDGFMYDFSNDIDEAVVNWIFLGSFRTLDTLTATSIDLQIGIPTASTSVDIYLTTTETNNKPCIANLTNVGHFHFTYVASPVIHIVTLDINDTLLNVDNTFNNTFYLGILAYPNSRLFNWMYRPDFGTASDSNDESMSYVYNTTSMNFLTTDKYWMEHSFDFVFNVTTEVESISYETITDTQIVEDGLSWYFQLQDTVQRIFTSFEVVENCVLENVSLNLRGMIGNANFSICIYNAIYNSTAIIPDEETILGNISMVTTQKWYNLTGLDYTLNLDETYNNTWFISAKLNEISGIQGRIYYCTDGSDGDSSDDCISYKQMNNESPFILIRDTHFGGLQTIDFALKIGYNINNIIYEEYPLTSGGIVEETIVIEDRVLSFNVDGGVKLFTDDLGNSVLNWIWFSSFNITDSCILTKVEFQLYPVDASSYDIYITNTTAEFIPDINGLVMLEEFNLLGTEEFEIISVNITDYSLESSNTTDNIFFIGILPHAVSGNSGWAFKTDTGTGGDNSDDSMAFIYNTTDMNPILMDGHWNVGSLDFVFNVTTEVNSFTFVPYSTFGISINGELIDENGLWSSQIVTNSFIFGINETFTLFNITIDYISIDYQKEIDNLNATLSLVSADYVSWDVNVVINEYKSGYFDKKLNFIIDSSWEILDVTNNSESITYSLIGNTIEINMVNSTNGEWQLLATSVNYVDTFEVLLDDESIIESYMNETILLRLQLIENVIGEGTFDIYNPLLVDNEVNITESIDFDGNNYIEFEINPSESFLTNGTYRIQAYWSNFSSAGVSNLEFTILDIPEISEEPIDPTYTLEYDGEVLINVNAMINITIEDLRVNILLFDNDSIQLYNFTSTDGVFNITYSDVGIYNFTLEIYHDNILNDSVEFSIEFILTEVPEELLVPNLVIPIVIIVGIGILGGAFVLLFRPKIDVMMISDGKFKVCNQDKCDIFNADNEDEAINLYRNKNM
jgi:hypothetical protein